jgi:hypothetical protein
MRTFTPYLNRPIGGGRVANLRPVYPPKTAPAVENAADLVRHFRKKALENNEQSIV